MLTEGHHKVEFIGVLKGKLEWNNEWTVHQGENCTFCQDVCDFSWALGNVCLADRLQGIDTLRILFPDLHDLAKAALADDFKEIKGLDGERFIAAGFEVNLEVERARTSSGGIPLI